mgnify:CR=1 FL=1
MQVIDLYEFLGIYLNEQKISKNIRFTPRMWAYNCASNTHYATVMNSNNHSRLLDMLGSYRDALRAAIIFSLVINLLLLTPTIYMLQVYDRVINSNNAFTLAMLTLMLVFAYGLQSAIEYIRSKMLISVSAHMQSHFNPTVFDITFSGGVGEKPTQPFSDFLQLRQFLTGKAMVSILDAPWSPIFIICTFLLNTWLGVYALLSTIVLIALSIANEHATSSPLQEASKQSIDSAKQITDIAKHSDAVGSMGMLSGLKRRWASLDEKVSQNQVQASIASAKISAASRFIKLTTQSGILGLGALLVLENQIGPGAMIASTFLLSRALGPMDQLISSWKSIAAAKLAYARLKEYLNEADESIKQSGLPAPVGKIAIENLHIETKKTAKNILSDITLTIEPSTITVIAGPSASGKTTLARAITGLIRPTHGVVRLDGVDVSAWDGNELGRYVGYLPQSIDLLNGSVAQNIARFEEVDMDKVVYAAKLAGVHEMILKLPDGYETIIGDATASLSGGQRQRVALARAMYNNPKVLVLDEPNSNLDQDGEKALAIAVDQCRRNGATILLITHRTFAAKLADNILLLKDGKIFKFGKREEVLREQVAQPA